MVDAFLICTAGLVEACDPAADVKGSAPTIYTSSHATLAALYEADTNVGTVADSVDLARQWANGVREWGFRYATCLVRLCAVETSRESLETTVSAIEAAARYCAQTGNRHLRHLQVSAYGWIESTGTVPLAAISHLGELEPGFGPLCDSTHSTVCPLFRDISRVTLDADSDTISVGFRFISARRHGIFIHGKTETTGMLSKINVSVGDLYSWSMSNGCQVRKRIVDSGEEYVLSSTLVWGSKDSALIRNGEIVHTGDVVIARFDISQFSFEITGDSSCLVYDSPVELFDGVQVSLSVGLVDSVGVNERGSRAPRQMRQLKARASSALLANYALTSALTPSWYTQYQLAEQAKRRQQGGD